MSEQEKKNASDLLSGLSTHILNDDFLYAVECNEQKRRAWIHCFRATAIHSIYIIPSVVDFKDTHTDKIISVLYSNIFATRKEAVECLVNIFNTPSIIEKLNGKGE